MFFAHTTEHFVEVRHSILMVKMQKNAAKLLHFFNICKHFGKKVYIFLGFCTQKLQFDTKMYKNSCFFTFDTKKKKLHKRNKPLV